MDVDVDACQRRRIGVEEVCMNMIMEEMGQERSVYGMVGCERLWCWSLARGSSWRTTTIGRAHDVRGI